MKTNIFITLLIVPVFLMAQDQEKPETFRTIATIVLNNKTYTAKATYTSLDFKLQLFMGSDSVKTPELAWDIQEELLTSILVSAVSQSMDTTLTVNSVSEEHRVAIGLLPAKVKALRESDKTEAQKTTAAVDKAMRGTSGILRLNKRVPYRLCSKPGRKKNKNKSDMISGLKKIVEKLFCKSKGEKEKKELCEDGCLEIKEAYVHFFNNKATKVFLRAQYGKGKDSEELTFLNHKYSLPLRAFNLYGRHRRNKNRRVFNNSFELLAKTKNKDTMIVALNDVFDYINTKAFNYSIANQEVVLNTDGDAPKDTAFIKERGFFDFFTGILYSDVLGINSGSSNSPLNAQASLLVLMNQKNARRFTVTRQFLTTANIALGNSFDEDSRFLSFSESDKVNHFDLFRKNNLNAKLALDLITYESKGWSLNTSLGYNGAFYRTGYSSTQTQDTMSIVRNGQLFSLSHGPYLNFEFRPQTNFGADVTFSLEQFAFNDSQEIGGRDFATEILEHDESQDFLLKHNLLGVSSNFYWLTKPGERNSGIYARAAINYHIATRSVFPQVFVGYATNLTAFVNQFGKTKSPETVKGK